MDAVLNLQLPNEGEFAPAKTSQKAMPIARRIYIESLHDAPREQSSAEANH